MSLLIISLLPTIIYAYYLLRYKRAWDGHRRQQSRRYSEPLGISVLVVVRNEEERISACLNALKKQDYPSDQMEIIVLNDFSTDETESILAGQEQLRVFDLSDHPDGLKPDRPNKKAALEWGLSLARYPIIACTDGDCIVPNNWLQQIALRFQEEHVQYLSGPVLLHRPKNFLEAYQALDLLAMAGLSAAAIGSGKAEMSNGGNMAFRKTAFEQMGGFGSNKEIPSGDDLFLMHRIEQMQLGSIGFLTGTEAVQTWPQADLSNLIQQRKRWLSKTAALPFKRIGLKLILILLFNLSMILDLFLAYFEPLLLISFVLKFFIKVFLDHRFLSSVARYYDRSDLMRYFWPVQLLHILYISTIGFLALGKSYRWKGREIRA